MMAMIFGPVFVIPAICAVRRVFGKRMSMKHRYSLWLLALLLHVLFPFAPALPKNSFSVLGGVELAKGQLLYHYPQAAPLINHLETGQVYVDEASKFWLVRAAGVDWQLILFCLWFFGAVLLTGWFCFVNQRFQKGILKKRVPLGKKSSMECKEPWLTLPVYLVKDLTSPCLLRIKGEAAIYVPDSILEDHVAFRHALAHEMSHYRQGDLSWNVLRMEILVVYWFHPAVWLGAWLSRQDCELSCDETAIALLGEEERFVYGRTLLKLVANVSAIKNMAYAGTFMGAGAKSLRKRILLIASKPKMTWWSVLGFYACVSLIAMLSFGKTDGRTGYPDAGEIVEQMGRQAAMRDRILLRQEEGSPEQMAEKMAVYLVEHHLQYVGDHVGSARIVKTCLEAVGVDIGGSVELQTKEEPYVFRYIFRTEEAGELPVDDMRAVSVLIFASIDNLGVLEFYAGEDGIHKEEQLLQITREDVLKRYGLEELQSFGGSVSAMKELVQMVQNKL